VGLRAALPAASSTLKRRSDRQARRLFPRRQVCPLAALAVAAVLLAACSSSTPAARPPSSSSLVVGRVVLANGGTVVVAVPNLPAGFNPFTPAGAGPVTAMVDAQVLPQAFVVDPQFNAELGPGLLSSAEVVSVQPQTVVYQIDPSARWANGTPITAADFVYLWREVLAHAAEVPEPGLLAGYEDISSIRGSDGGRSVTVTFSRPDADWEALFDGLVPPFVAERYGWSRGFAAEAAARLVSGGPFEISRIVPGRELVLVRNPRYWGPPAHLERIVLAVGSTLSSVLAGLGSGSVEVAVLPAGNRVDAFVAAHPELFGQAALAPVLWQICFNLADPVVGQLAVRSGVAAALDRPLLLADAAGLVAPATPLTDNRVFETGEPGSQGNAGPYDAPDPTLAASSFASAGYSVGAAGLLRAGGVGPPLVLRLAFPSGDSLAARTAAVVQAELLAAGVVVQLEPVPLSQLLGTLLPSGRYQMALAPFMMSPFPSLLAGLYTDPTAATAPAVAVARLPGAPSAPAAGAATAAPAPAESPSAVEPGAVEAGVVMRDVTGFTSPSVADELAAATEQLNLTKSDALYNAADLALWQELPTVPLFQQPVVVVTPADLVNVSMSPGASGIFWDAQDWAIELSPPPTTTTVP
jgi:ABC-type transport system substrate-binding protein